MVEVVVPPLLPFYTNTIIIWNFFLYLGIVQSLWICCCYCLPQYFQLFSFADLVGNHPHSVQNSSRRQVVLMDHESSWHKLVHLQPRTCKINTRYTYWTPKLRKWHKKDLSNIKSNSFFLIIIKKSPWLTKFCILNNTMIILSIFLHNTACKN